MKRKLILSTKVALVLLAVVALLILSTPFDVSLLFCGLSWNNPDIVDDFIDTQGQHIRIVQATSDGKSVLLKLRETPFRIWLTDEKSCAGEDGLPISCLTHTSTPKATSYLSPGGHWVFGSQVWEIRVYLFADEAEYLVNIPDSILHPNQTAEVRQYNSAYVVKIHSYEQAEDNGISPHAMDTVRDIYDLLAKQYSQ